jgi:hypothetical protein
VAQWPTPAWRKWKTPGMIGAATTLIALLLTAEFGSETIDVQDRGAVDLATYQCRDTPRSTLIQRACYDPARASMIVSIKSGYIQYCDVPPATFDALMAAPSMGQFFKRNLEGAGAGRYVCGSRQATRVRHGSHSVSPLFP